jgi:nickel transport protein
MTRISPLLISLALAMAPVQAAAHNVIAAFYPSGDAIEGDIGFSNGDMAANQRVTVTGPDGAALGETVTDADGFLLFVPVLPVAHTFRADLGAGHVAQATVPADEVAAILGVAAPAPAPAQVAAPGVAPASLTAEERAAISEAVRDATRPLRRELVAYREKNDLQSVLGGIGYIAGLFGLGFYLAARRKLQG